MFKSDLVFLLICVFCIENIVAQIGLQISSRYNFNAATVRDEFPPDIFLAIYGSQFSNLNGGIELHYDADFNNRNWPDVGKYTMKSTTVGIRVLYKYSFLHWNVNSVYFGSGFGVHKSVYRLKTDVDFIKKFIITPTPKVNAYGYLSIGVTREITYNGWLSLDGGIGHRIVQSKPRQIRLPRTSIVKHIVIKYNCQTNRWLTK